MLHASALAIGWKSALLALIDARKQASELETQASEASAPADATEQGDDEREPFHLDDTELAQRVVRDRGLVRYRTPPSTYVIPYLTQK
jgi:hypothetical protein